MLETTHSSHGNRNFHESVIRVLKRLNRQLKRNTIPLGLSALAVVSLGQSGCSSNFRNIAGELNNNILIEYRDAVWSRRAYNLRYGNCDRPFSNHFRDGFCAGYMDVSNGGDGYVPALPPQEYRGYEYQSAEGAQCVNTWFEGYPAGVAAAKQDKTGEYKDMFISKMINSAITQENATHSLPSDVPVIKSRFGTEASNGSTGTSKEAPPAPEVTQTYDYSHEPKDGNELSLAGSETSYGPAYSNAVSVVEPITLDTSALEEIRPALPPIVKGSSAHNHRIYEAVSARPSEGSPQPLPIGLQVPTVRQANASVISNQYTR